METTKLLTWKVNGIKSHKIEIKQFVLENDVDIVCLQEAKHEDDSNINIPGYQYHSIDSFHRLFNNTRLPYRGLVAYVKNTIPSKQCPGTNMGAKSQVLTVGIHDQ